MALYELEDKEKAFQWIGDSLIAHVSDEALEALIDMGRSEGDFKRVETVLSRALEEVSDGPLVRKLLGTRGRLRRDELAQVREAAEDLKRLHDLSPGDSELVSELSALYTSLEDYRGMVQLFEDQILRSKDQTLRGELAREVALLWRDKLQDPRETADAWRRVLRIVPGDAEATEGLTAAKQAMLKHKAPSAAAIAAETAPTAEPPPVAPIETSATEAAVVDAPVETSVSEQASGTEADLAPALEQTVTNSFPMDAVDASSVPAEQPLTSASEDLSLSNSDDAATIAPGAPDEAVTIPPKAADEAPAGPPPKPRKSKSRAANHRDD